MQERYLGDSHDFIKYALLRHLAAATGMRLGINWYLTASENVDGTGNNDGEKRRHLAGGEWQATDPILFDKIGQFAALQARKLANVERFGIVPETTLFHDRLISGAERDCWHRQAMQNLAATDLVFLDPDNGFEVPSTSRRAAPKYARYQEAADYFRAGKTVVAIQFARQCDPIGRAREVRKKLAETAGLATAMPVVRARLAPNILFITLAPEPARERIVQALEGFASKCSKAELID